MKRAALVLILLVSGACASAGGPNDWDRLVSATRQACYTHPQLNTDRHVDAILEELPGYRGSRTELIAVCDSAKK